MCRRCARKLARIRAVRVRLGEARVWEQRVGSGPGAGLTVRAAGRLEGVWGRIVRACKEDPTPAITDLVAGMVLRGRPGPQPILVPVPMAPVRRRERGFNPPEILARALARRLGGEVRLRALRRSRYRRPLRGLRASERRRLMAGAFEPGPEAIALRGRSVVLVDDVLTTGATLGAAAAGLRDAGVPAMEGWVLGRTPKRNRIRARDSGSR